MTGTFLLAQGISTWGIGNWIIAAIVIAAMVAVLYVILGKMGVQIPPWFVHIVWILIAAVVGVLAIKFLMGLF